jgi:hypothetical protein
MGFGEQSAESYLNGVAVAAIVVVCTVCGFVRVWGMMLDNMR